MRTRVVFAVGLAAIVLLSGVGPVVGMHVGEHASDAGAPTDRVDAPTDATDAPNSAAQGYEVSLDNVTVQTWLLRNSTVRNATVEEVVVRNATTPDGARENVTLTNVTVGEFVVDRGRLLNVSATQLIVRDKSVLDVPGGEFIDPNVEDRTIDREWTRNATVAGVVIDRMSVDAAVLCGNASLGEAADDASAFDPQADDDDPAITVENGSAEEALVIRGQASNWQVESMDEPETENASLPQGCERGQGGEGDAQGDGEGTEQGDGEGGDQGDGEGDGQGNGEGGDQGGDQNGGEGDQ